MKQVEIVIEKTVNHYDAYAENVEGIYGGGETIEKAKQSIIIAIELSTKYNDRANLPSILNGKYNLLFKFGKNLSKSY